VKKIIIDTAGDSIRALDKPGQPCKICGAPYADCKHHDFVPIRLCSRWLKEEFPTASWGAFSGMYSFLGAPVWYAYDEKGNFLGETQGGRSLSIME